jgi:hypothetical protein
LKTKEQVKHAYFRRMNISLLQRSKYHHIIITFDKKVLLT